jgi:pyruvate,orthophosphate dikinase
MQDGADAKRFVHDIVEVEPNDARRFGGKAASLARMAAAGLAIPPAFVISTEGFRAFRDSGGQLPATFLSEVHEAVRQLEALRERPVGTAAGGLSYLFAPARP